MSLGNRINYKGLIIIICFSLIFSLSSSPVLAEQEEDLSGDWFEEITGEMDIDKVNLVENLEAASLPLLHLKNYLDGIFPALEEPGLYRVFTETREEGLFTVEEVEQEDLQFEDQPESWEEGDEWVWEIHDDERFVEIILTAEIIDTVREPGLPMMSRIVFNIEYAEPQVNFSGTVRIRDDFGDVDMILEADNRKVSFQEYSLDLNVNLLDRAEDELAFEGDLQYPGVVSDGTHRFLFTQRPRELPRTQPLYLDEYIFRGFFSSDTFALEGDMWICTESIVMNGYTVIN